MTQPGLSIIDAMGDPAVFAPWFPGATWGGWHVVLKAAFALPMTKDEVALFRTMAERDPPVQPVKEFWIIVGRRGGKDSVASVIVAYIAAMFSDQHQRLRPGERASVVCLATDRDQAKIILNYIRSYFTEIEMLRDMVINGDGTASGFELDNGVDVSILTSSFRAVRGRAILAAVLDECAFWRDETSSNPDVEVYNALRPGLASLPGSVLIGISSPYARSGLLYKKYKDHFGKDLPDVLVIKAPTRALNPTIDQAIIDAAMADDPAAARAEWMAEFRDDVQALLTREVIEAAVVPGRYELAPVLGGYVYNAFLDAAGGSGQDLMTLAIAHAEGDPQSVRGVLDLTREWRPQFSPKEVVAEAASLLKLYGISRIEGDRWGGDWPREAFRAHGIEYEVAERTKSDIYRDFLPTMNSGRIELLDNPRLVAQFAGLERRTARGGRDSIDHAPGAHDDIANAASGALVSVTVSVRPGIVFTSVSSGPSSDRAPRRYGNFRYLGGGFRTAD